MPTRNYPFAAGETKHLGSGNRLRLLNTTDPVTVRFFKNGTEIVSEAAEDVEAGFQGEPPRPSNGGSAFDDVTIESATAQTVKIFTTRGDSRYDRSVGDVLSAPKLTQRADTPYGFDALTANGFCFVGVAQVGAAAGVNSIVQLLNPAGSGLVVFVDRLVVSAGASTLQVCRHDAALLTLARTGKNRNVGAADALAQVRTEQMAVSPADDPFFANIDLADASPFEILFSDGPLRLEAGEGVIVLPVTQNLKCTANWFFREYA